MHILLLTGSTPRFKGEDQPLIAGVLVCAQDRRNVTNCQMCANQPLLLDVSQLRDRGEGRDVRCVQLKLLIYATGHLEYKLDILEYIINICLGPGVFLPPVWSR